MASENDKCTNRSPGRPSKLASVISGAASGALISACVQPLDVLRTRMQAEAARGHFTTTIATLSAVLKEGGIKSLWKGTQPTVIRLGIGAGLHFFFLESIKPLVETKQADGSVKMGVLGAAITGGVSRALAAMISCPFTLVKTRMEYSGVGAVQYRSTFHGLHSVASSEGIRGLYRGLGPTVLANAPYSALYYIFYTQLQSKLSAPDRPTVVVNGSSSLIAAISATIITQPADVLRTRIQLGMAGTVTATGGAVSLKLIQKIAAEQGMRGFFAGAPPRMIKRTIQTSLVWTLYEELLPRLTKVKEWVVEEHKAAVPR